MLAAGKQAGIHRVTQTDLDYLSGLQNGSADDPCSLSIVRRGFRAISIGKSNSPSIVVDEPFGCRSIDRCQRRWWWFEFKRRLTRWFSTVMSVTSAEWLCTCTTSPRICFRSWRPHPFRTTTALSTTTKNTELKVTLTHLSVEYSTNSKRGFSMFLSASEQCRHPSWRVIQF